jgi:myo-inositol 2-dehydrogenase/D-chiro-inositol 1-dehydrogenase
MKLALLGADEATLEIARCAIQSNHELVLLAEHNFAGAPTESVGRLREALPGRLLEMPWESLLYDRKVDAVIVGRGADQELRAEELRKLVQAGVPLVVSHPVVDSMLVYYELDMIRRESGCQIAAIMPWRWHPATAQLTTLVDEADGSPIGPVGQAVFERTMARRDRASVSQQFARDVDLIRVVCGDVSRLSALGAANIEAAYANLGVQMSGAGPIVVRWSVGPVEDEPRGSLTLVGARGKAVLQMPERNAWRLEIRGDGKVETESFLAWQSAPAALEELISLLKGDAPNTPWPEAARSVELAEAVDRSLVKGRTVELHKEEFTEVGTFKGMMTSLGCGILLAGLIAIFVLAVVEGVARKAGAIQMADALRFWPYALAGLLGVFLLLQVVVKFAATSEPRGSESTQDARDVSDGHS